MTSLARSNLAMAVLCSVMLGLAATTARPGPDFPAYRDWSNALVRTDLEELASSQRSPSGRKLTQWLAGPALPYALPQALSLGAIDAEKSIIVMGCVVALVTAGLLAGLFRQLSVDRPTTTFWFAAALVASPIGYYALAFSSETLAVWLVTLLLGVLFAGDRRPHPLVVGLAIALLLMTRPYWGSYALPTLAVVIRRDLFGGSRRRLLVGGLAIAVPILAALVELGLVNRWMTGDVWRFVYVFGDAEFQSLDFRNPEWGAVLWHPLHGLLVCHPALGLGFLAMLRLLFRAPTAGERVAWGTFAVIIATNVYVQASWFCWWQGTGITHGMRGLVPAAVPAMAAAARLVQLSPRAAIRSAVIGLTTICGFWSWLFLPPGPTDFVTYSALAEGLRTELDKMLDPRFIFLAMPAAFVFAVLAAALSIRPDGKRAYVSGIASAGLLSLWIVYTWTQLLLGPAFFGWLNPKRDPFLAAQLPMVQWGVAAAFAGAAGLAGFLLARFSIDWLRLCERVTALVAVGALLLFGFAAYGIETAPVRVPRRLPTYPGKVYYVTEIRASWDDYQTIPGFDGPKRRLLDFMIREGIPTDVTSGTPTEWNSAEEPARVSSSDRGSAPSPLRS